jgi:hypothetical protein
MTITRFLLACLAASAAWFIAEASCGLAFLAADVRLWRYDICPVLCAITSPLAWPLAGALIIPLSWTFDRLVANRYRGGRKFLARLAFVMAVGPVLEVAINDCVCKGCLGYPMYEYLVLPTFSGSGSLLSPLYYSTVLIHLPLTDRLLTNASTSAYRRPETPRRAATAANSEPLWPGESWTFQ